jgi:hypothetical protein
VQPIDILRRDAQAANGLRDWNAQQVHVHAPNSRAISEDAIWATKIQVRHTCGDGIIVDADCVETQSLAGHCHAAETAKQVNQQMAIHRS